MPLALVTDEDDTLRNTAFVNALHQLSCGRAVVHVPSGSRALYDEVLRSLDRVDHSGPSPTARVRRAFAEAWLLAHDRFDLFVYGAWRLAERETSWLETLAAASDLTVWVITHANAENLARLRQSADQHEQFSGFVRRWDSAPTDPAPAPAPAAGTEIAAPPEGGPDMLPWPWGLAEAFTADDPEPADQHWTAAWSVRSMLTTAMTISRMAESIGELFAAWTSTAARTFALNVIREHQFHAGYWFDWAPALPTLEVNPRHQSVVPGSSRIQHPGRAAHHVLEQLAPSVALDLREVRFAPSGRVALLPDGESVPVPVDAQPTIRAYLHLDAQRDLPITTIAEPSWASRSLLESFFRDERERAFATLTTIAGSIDLRPVRRLNDPVDAPSDASELLVDDTTARNEHHEPVHLQQHHGAVLADILQFDRRANVRQQYAPRVRQRADIHALEDLVDLGLARASGPESPTPVLAPWLWSFWARQRPTEPS